MNLTKTIITYCRRAYCAYVCYYYDYYLLMSKLVVLECAIGYKQFYPMGSPKVPQNRLFAQFFFSGHQIDEMKSGIISSIVTESFTQGVIFATVAFGVGIGSLYVERVIHLVYLALWKVSSKKVEEQAEVEGSFVSSLYVNNDMDANVQGMQPIVREY